MYRQEEPELNLDELLEKLRGFFRKFRLGGGGGGFLYALVGIFALSFVIWMATGIYSVQQGERAAMRRLGIFTGDIVEPGLHWFWPAPIGTKNVVSVEEIRRLELGFRGGTPVLAESLMITGDTNIVDAQMLVQYNIKDLEQFLFRIRDPEGVVLKSAAETALRQVVGLRDIDDVLTTEKEAVQDETKLLLQELLDLYQTGIRVTQVKLQNVRPPFQVQDAFDDVVRAREDKERIVNLAQAYKADIVPRAEGDALRVEQEADAFKAERIAKATGESERFLKVLEEYSKAPEVTRQRLYLEAMEEILPGITKFIVDSETGGGLLQFLPLTDSSAPVPQPQDTGQR